MEPPKPKDVFKAKLLSFLGNIYTKTTNDLQIDLNCPISRELFEDPVICAGDGQTYERTEIEEWLKNKNTSPFNTSKPLSSKTLIPNIAVRKLADAVRVEKLEKTRTDEVPELKVQETRQAAGFDDGYDTYLREENENLLEEIESYGEQIDEYHDTIAALSAKCLCTNTEFPRDPLTNVYKMAFCNLCGHALPEDTPDMYQVEMSGLPEFAEDSFTDDYYLGHCDVCRRENDRRIAARRIAARLRD